MSAGILAHTQKDGEQMFRRVKFAYDTLPDQFKQYKTQILSAITPTKDVDGLWGVLTGLSSIDLIDFVPATPRAVLYLLDKYNLWDMKGKTVAIIGQSNIVGRPLIIDCVKRWATVASFNQENSLEEIKTMCKQSDYIISCTGKVHLVDETFLRDDHSQIVVDVGFWHKDGNPVGDVVIEKIKDKVRKLSVDTRLKVKFGEQIALSERQMRLIEYISDQGSGGMNELKKVLPMVSEDTILRELRDLLTKGILKKTGTTKASKYVVANK